MAIVKSNKYVRGKIPYDVCVQRWNAIDITTNGSLCAPAVGSTAGGDQRLVVISDWWEHQHRDSCWVVISEWWDQLLVGSVVVGSGARAH